MGNFGAAFGGGGGGGSFVYASGAAASLAGEILFSGGKTAEARHAYEAAKAADPSFTEAALALARIDLREKNTDGARQELTGVLNSEPRNIAALLMLASVDAQTGNRDRAIAAYRAVLDIDEKNVSALNDLAWNLAIGNPNEALKYAQQAGTASWDTAG